MLALASHHVDFSTIEAQDPILYFALLAQQARDVFSANSDPSAQYAPILATALLRAAAMLGYKALSADHPRDLVLATLADVMHVRTRGMLRVELRNRIKMLDAGVVRATRPTLRSVNTSQIEIRKTFDIYGISTADRYVYVDRLNAAAVDAVSTRTLLGCVAYLEAHNDWAIGGIVNMIDRFVNSNQLIFTFTLLRT